MSIFYFFTGCSDNPYNEIKLFGDRNFSSSEWKAASSENKSKMLYSFLQNHDVTSYKADDIYNLLGNSTAYYEYDEFPAYEIISDKKKYILAFPVDRETHKIRKYVLTTEK